ncbi:DNA repair protein RadA [bacterium]|nr:DNA repair protein RadA [bacterium]
MSDKIKEIYSCSKCGAQFPKWSGRCLECGSWGTLSKEILESDVKKKVNVSNIKAAELIDLRNLENENLERYSTNWPEIDKVLGGGLVPGSLLLFSGEPGVGKTTLLSQLSDLLAKNRKVFYISGEESANQVKQRLIRLNCNLEKIKFVNETNVEKIVSLLKKENPDIVIIDSIQTIYSNVVESEPGNLSQIRACASIFLEVAKGDNISIVLIGHITKDGQIAGPKALEHIVDTVLYLEHDFSNNYIILKSTKNRFGSINEIGLLEMTQKGFVEIKKSADLFIEDNNLQIAGSVIGSTVEGSRVFLLDIQALVSKTVFGYPQRKTAGFDSNRLQVISSVISKRTKINLSSSDIILNIVGGFKINDPSLDLAVCLSIISASLDIKIDRKVLVIGEVGLGGEVRSVNKLNLRLKTAIDLGFKKVIMPKQQTKNISVKNKLEIIGVSELKELVEIIQNKKGK